MASVACFLHGKGPFDEELRFFSKMAADSSIGLSCFFEVEIKWLFWKSKMACIWMTIDINWNQKW